MNQQIEIAGKARMQQIGQQIAKSLSWNTTVFLEGGLGAGKTTLVQGILSGLGFDGLVSSPTYTLVEYYSLTNGPVYHLDLYRLENPQELESIGIRDMFAERAIILVEWPDRGSGYLPEPDITLNIEYSDAARVLYGPNSLLHTLSIN